VAAISGAEASAVAPSQPQSVYEIRRIEDEAGVLDLCKELQSARRLAIVVGEELALSADGTLQYEISLSGGTLLTPGLDPARVLALLKPILEDAAIEKAVFDAKALQHMLDAYGVRLCGVKWDAMIQDYLLHAIHPANSLNTLCAERGRVAGAAALWSLCVQMQAEMEVKGLWTLYETVELPLVWVLYDMEKEGFSMDAEVLKHLSASFGARMQAAEEGIYALAGERFNILSPKQLGAVLFEKLGLPAQKKTKTGYSTDAAVLEALEDKHPIVALVTEYRFLSKMKSTFLDGLLGLMQPDGRVHTSFNQNVTATGRISSTEPNLQNIPVRTDLGREIRRAFVASPGRVLVGADYSQIELRLLAHMSGDAAMVEAFRRGADIHAITASEVFGVSPQNLTPAQRSAAKAVNFGIVYGISEFGLARNIGVSRREAGDYIAGYFRRYPGVKAFLDRCVEEGRARGYAATLLGRRRDLPELASANFNTRSFGERVAMNMPIQGTAADIIKLAMVRVKNALKEQGLRAKLILQIHDELIIDTPIDEVEQVKCLLCACMEGAMELSVPLVAEVREGHSWYDTK